MSTIRLVVMSLVINLCGVALGATPLGAQTIGNFTFALQPYCNVATLTVTQEGNTYRLAGWDDACGSAERLPARGTIAPNLDGTLHIAFTVTRTNGVAVETSVRNFAVGPYAGGWTDSAGNAGNFVLGGAPGGNGARPGPATANSISTVNIIDGSINAVDVNQMQVQVRVSGSCPARQAVRSVNQDGSLVCVAWDVVPSGTTIIGEFRLDGDVGDGGASGSTAFYVPFGAVAPAGISAANVNFASGLFQDADASCTGSYLAPTAPAGKVCIYWFTTQSVLTASTQGTSALLNTRGFLIVAAHVSGSLAGDRLQLAGTWAYTAP